MTQVLIHACKNGDLETVISELYKGVDPSAENNFAIRWAAANGHLAVVERLLQDDRVDPAAENNFAIRWAAADGHLAVVECLLQDDKVDPAAVNNFAIRWAAMYGHVKAVVTLFNHLKQSNPETIEALKNNYDIKACFRANLEARLLASSFFRQSPAGTEEVVLAALESETPLCKDDAEKIAKNNLPNSYS